MAEKKQTNHPTPIDPKKVEKIWQKIIELVDIYGDNLNVDHINEILEIICSIDSTFLNGTSQDNDFYTFEDIEQLMLEQNRLIQDANLRNLFSYMKRLSGEKGIVLKKTRTSEKRDKG